MLFVIGLGLGDPKDITIKGLEIVKKCDIVYLEAYTSILSTGGQQALEDFYGRSLVLADRELVEQNSNVILQDAKTKEVAFLVVGDPFGATTHTDLILRAKELNIPVQVVHNASIINAVGCCGLQLYTFGEVVSIPFWTESWKPDSFYHKILVNLSHGLHTLCLLDIRVKEPTLESMTKKHVEYEPARFMSVSQAAHQLLQIVHSVKDIDTGCPNDGDCSNHRGHVIDESTKCVGLARIGSDTQQIVYCSLKNIQQFDLGPPLHSLVIPGRIQPLEEDYLKQYLLP